MIEIRYEKNGLDISGTPDELYALKVEIQAFLRSDASSLTIEAAMSFDPHPYDKAIPKMVIRKASGLVKVSVVDVRKVIVSGSVEDLEGFESYFEFDLDTESGDHCHFEYYEGHDFIDRDSTPLVIGIK